MTGGVADKYDLTKPETKSAVDSGQFWKDLKSLTNKDSLLSVKMLWKMKMVSLLKDME